MFILADVLNRKAKAQKAGNHDEKLGSCCKLEYSHIGWLSGEIQLLGAVLSVHLVTADTVTAVIWLTQSPKGLWELGTIVTKIAVEKAFWEIKGDSSARVDLKPWCSASGT